jgi:hypothetical protein
MNEKNGIVFFDSATSNNGKIVWFHLFQKKFSISPIY